MTAGSLRSADANGYYWHSTAHASLHYAYSLVFNDISIFPSRSNDRWLGFMVQVKNRIYCLEQILKISPLPVCTDKALTPLV